MSNKVMDGCSYDEKEDGVSIALTQFSELRQRGRHVDIAYLVGIMRMRRTNLRYIAKGGKRAQHLSLTQTGEDGEEFDLLGFLNISTQPRQLRMVEAREALRACLKLPKRAQAVILRRADGAHPGEIADELQMEIADVLQVLADARVWLAGHYV